MINQMYYEADPKWRLFIISPAWDAILNLPYHPTTNAHITPFFLLESHSRLKMQFKFHLFYQACADYSCWKSSLPLWNSYGTRGPYHSFDTWKLDSMLVKSQTLKSDTAGFKFQLCQFTRCVTVGKLLNLSIKEHDLWTGKRIKAQDRWGDNKGVLSCLQWVQVSRPGQITSEATERMCRCDHRASLSNLWEIMAKGIGERRKEAGKRCSKFYWRGGGWCCRVQNVYPGNCRPVSMALVFGKSIECTIKQIIFEALERERKSLGVSMSSLKASHA